MHTLCPFHLLLHSRGDDENFMTSSHSTYDHIIVGAGISGLSAAYWLEKTFPDQKVLLLDQSQPGSGASGANAGFLTNGSFLFFHQLVEKFGKDQALAIWKFCRANHQCLKEELHLETQDGYRQEGSLTLVHEPSSWENLQQAYNILARQGEPVALLSPYELPAFLRPHCVGAGFFESDGSICPQKLIQKLFSQLKSTEFQSKKIQKVFNQEDEVQLQSSENDSFSAKNVILTLNGYIQGLAPEVPVRPVRAQCLLTTPVSQRISPNIYLSDLKMYFTQKPSGELLFGGARPQDPQSEETSTPDLNFIIQNELQKQVQNLFGSKPQIQKQWAGIMGFSSSELPFVEETRAHIYFMGGFSGHGMGMAFHLARKFIEKLGSTSPPQKLTPPWA